MDIETDILMALRRIMRATELHSQELARTHGLTGPQLLLLRTLEGEDQGLTITELARRLALAQPTVTGIVGRLTERTLVARSRPEADRRRVLVHLTPRGVALLATAPPALQERFSRGLRELTELERTAMLGTLQRIVVMMDADHLEAAPVLVSGATIIDEGARR